MFITILHGSTMENRVIFMNRFTSKAKIDGLSFLLSIRDYFFECKNLYFKHSLTRQECNSLTLSSFASVGACICI